jgi:hypothetical protein
LKHVVRSKPMTLTLAVACVLGALGIPSVALAQPTVTRTAAEPKVCRWVYRNDRRMMHCGLRTDMLALAPGRAPALNEAATLMASNKSIPRAISIPTDAPDSPDAPEASDSTPANAPASAPASAPNAVATSAASRNTVHTGYKGCRWVYRNERRTMFCGNRSAMLALAPGKAPALNAPAIATARTTATAMANNSIKPIPLAISLSTKTPEAVAVSNIASNTASVASHDTASTRYIAAKLDDNHSALRQLAPMSHEHYPRTSSPDSKTRASLKAHEQQAALTEIIAWVESSTPQRVAYMVKAVGNTPAVIAQLATLHDKDHALLRKRHAQNGTSLDFFNRRSNAKRRQQSLAAQGIVSELFEHKLRQPAQPLVAKLD